MQIANTFSNNFVGLTAPNIYVKNITKKDNKYTVDFYILDSVERPQFAFNQEVLKNLNVVINSEKRSLYSYMQNYSTVSSNNYDKVFDGIEEKYIFFLSDTFETTGSILQIYVEVNESVTSDKRLYTISSSTELLETAVYYNNYVYVDYAFKTSNSGTDFYLAKDGTQLSASNIDYSIVVKDLSVYSSFIPEVKPSGSDISRTFNDIYLSRGTAGNVKGFFSFSLEKLLLDNSRLFRYFYGNDNIRKTILTATEISATVKRNKYISGENNYNKISQKNTIVATEVQSVNELDTYSDRAYTFNDKEFASSTDGLSQYYYSIDLKIQDICKEVGRVYFNNFDNSISILEEYRNRLIRYKYNNSNYIKDEFFKYELTTELLSSLNTAVSNIIFMYEFFNNAETEKKFTNLLISTLHPLYTNVDLISQLISFVSKMKAELTKLFLEVQEPLNNYSTNSLQTNPETVYEITYNYNKSDNRIDSSVKDFKAFEYVSINDLEARKSTEANLVGLTSYNAADLELRANREATKFGVNRNQLTDYSFSPASYENHLLYSTNDLNSFSNAFYEYKINKNVNYNNVQNIFVNLLGLGINVNTLLNTAPVSQLESNRSVLNDTNPDSRETSARFVASTRIDNLFVSINKDNTIFDNTGSFQYINSLQSISTNKSNLEYYPQFYFNLSKIGKLNTVIINNEQPATIQQALSRSKKYSIITIASNGDDNVYNRYFILAGNGPAVTRDKKEVFFTNAYKQINIAVSNIKPEYLRNAFDNKNDEPIVNVQAALSGL